MNKKLEPITVKKFIIMSSYTQSSLARKLDCTSQTVSSWVRGLTNPANHFKRVLLEVMAEKGYTLKEKSNGR